MISLYMLLEVQRQQKVYEALSGVMSRNPRGGFKGSGVAVFRGTTNPKNIKKTKMELENRAWKKKRFFCFEKLAFSGFM